MRALQLPVFASAIFSIVAGLQAPAAIAKTFKTQFIKFELPANWSCKQEEIDWVCQPDNLAERSEALLVVVTKAVNQVDDSFPKYEEILNARRNMRDLLGNAYQSEVKSVRQRTIRGQNWVDALHLGSEIPGFYTRYVASIKEQVAGLLTYSVAESVYPKYAALLDSMVDSLEITFDPKAFAEFQAAGPTTLFGKRSARGGRGAPIEDGDGKLAADDKKSAPLDSTDIGIGLFIMAAVGYVIYRRKKANG